MALYKGGVTDNLPCVSNQAKVLAGIDSDEEGEFLIVRNAWGPSWGENGNFRISRRVYDKTCFLENRLILPIVKQTTNSVLPNPVPGFMKLLSHYALKS